jgi:hypothetical protein
MLLVLSETVGFLDGSIIDLGTPSCSTLLNNQPIVKIHFAALDKSPDS